MKNWSAKLAIIVVSLWVGGLWAIGFLAAPTLFSALPGDKQMAGVLAGKMFTLMSYVGIASAFYLLIYALASQGVTALKQGLFWIALLMLLLVLAGHFGIQPILSSLKQQALPLDVMQSVFASRFKTWHGVASMAYLLESLLGLVLLFKVRA
jgi:hypothetical protein